MTSNYLTLNLTNLVRFIFFISFVLFLIYFFVFFNTQTGACLNEFANLKNYNHTYPLTKPIKSKHFISYRIGLISDEDNQAKSYSKKGTTWTAFYMKGYLTYYPATKRIEFKFDNETRVTGRLNYSKRGFELSELIVFNGKLLTCDDKTGIIYQLIEIDQNLIQNSNQTDSENYPFQFVPLYIMADGDGVKESVFKCEWITVKDQHLYVGSFGKNFAINKKIKYTSWIKRINMNGFVEHLNWTSNYQKLKDIFNLTDEAYLSHEAVIYSEIQKKWFFLPRKLSETEFEKTADESKGTNVMIEASEDFKVIKYRTVGTFNQTHGFSSAKFLPNFNDEIIIALKTTEIGDTYSTFVTVFDLNGQELYPETFISEHKFEGIEFI